jgi:hypothetical protein
MEDIHFRQIVWLASFPKSGNTWLRLFLDAYYLGDIDINNIATSTGDNAGILHAVDNMSANRFPWQVQQLMRHSALLKQTLNYINTRHANIPMFVKTHSCSAKTMDIELLPHTLTKCVVYLVRDPRDIVPSYAAHMGMTYDEAITSMSNNILTLESSKQYDEQMLTHVTSWNLNVSSYLKDKSHNVLFVKYEDLKANPVQTFSTILGHVGVKADEDRVKKAIKTCDLSKLKKQEEEKGFAEACAHGSKFFGQEHKNLTVAQRRRVENLFGREMRQLGYL